MKRIFRIAALALLASLPAFAATTPAPQSTPAPQLTLAQQASRDATREKLRKLLEAAGARKDVNITFRQSDKQPYNFLGAMSAGLTNADNLEIVIGVTTNETIGFRVYPHYKGEYINVDKVKNGAGLMRKLLFLSDRNFLYWGIDASGDVFSGYTVTLESGFPDEAMTTVIRSIRNTDGFVGEMRPFIDGTSAP
ncbi:MAG: hypothetical protein QOE33_921 [Acidobacteriota bacterium]|nr:hypothetical protein [Acidobacteriota bacterium]